VLCAALTKKPPVTAKYLSRLLRSLVYKARKPEVRVFGSYLLRLTTNPTVIPAMADQKTPIISPQISQASQPQLKLTFNEDASLYDRSRPHYPFSVFSDLSTLIPLSPSSRILEIGCGTGQTTLPLAKLGSNIVAIELGPSLASLASQNLSSYPNVQVLCSSFEDWPLPLSGEEKFDVVLAATSWNWLDERVRVEKSGDALKEKGSLVVISTHHIARGNRNFLFRCTATLRTFHAWD
jgi:SAM-dependent methyltransferase